MSDSYVLGIDFGTDSVRCVLIDATSGEEITTSTFLYPRWQKKLFCDPVKNQYRQHPLDYIEGIESIIKECLKKAGTGIAELVKAIGVGTTGSTPCPVNRDGVPLALARGYEENPNAMFILWKDHTAIAEAEKINTVNASLQNDYLQYVGGTYSSEWFWAKMLHVYHVDRAIGLAAATWLEHSDWMPFFLTGKKLQEVKRNICAAGHKGLWAHEFEGLPPVDFFKAIDPYLEKMANDFPGDFVTSVEPIGTLSEAWAEKLGLSKNVVIAAGIIDAHAGAIGAEVKQYELVKIVGTSTCDITIVPPLDMEGKTIKGICGQVLGSVHPDYIGLEAGQSAFGDLFNWFVSLLGWSQQSLSRENTLNIFEKLSMEAAALPPDIQAPVCVDWFNGCRTPFANQHLKGSISQLTLASGAPAIFRSLVEGVCLGARKINECFIEQGIPVKEVTATGGIAKKSPYVMQVLADILGIPIKVHKSENTCAIGAAINASVAAGLFKDIREAIATLGQGYDKKYFPDKDLKEFYAQRAILYDQAASFAIQQ